MVNNVREKILRSNMVMILIMAGSLILTITMAAIGFGWYFSEPGYKGKKKENFDGTRFINPGNIKAKGYMDLIKWGLNREKGAWNDNYETFVGESPPPVEDSLVQITFVNHSTFLVQMNGVNLLTDPIWSDRCSPLTWIGPKRKRPPGISFDDLPQIDLVIISHNHYDHLDIETIRQLEKRFQPQFITPLGVDIQLRENGCNNVVSLNWWEKYSDRQIPIQLVPAIHFSGRGINDRDKTLWGGYLLGDQSFRIYFAGDTGYGDIFKEIGQRAGRIDLSLLPIGAYKPNWFMSPIHISPEEAIRVHQDLNSKKSIAIHFGTFPLADEGQGEAEKDLKRALMQKGITDDEFITPEEGVSLIFNKN